MQVSFDFNFWTLLLFAMNFGLALFVSVSNRSKAAHDELKAMKTDLQNDIKQLREGVTQQLVEHGNRLGRAESDIENAIGDDDMKAIHRRVDEILASSKTMEGQVLMMADSLKSIQQIMLSRGNHV